MKFVHIMQWNIIIDDINQETNFNNSYQNMKKF
jgi:hypothetical protein